MERESLLVTLIVLFSGLTVQSVAAWPARAGVECCPAQLERLLPARFARLLRPLPELSPRRPQSHRLAGALLTITLLAAVAVGHACGDRLIGPLLALSYTLCA